jgi:hypothetical protein
MTDDKARPRDRDSRNLLCTAVAPEPSGTIVVNISDVYEPWGRNYEKARSRLIYAWAALTLARKCSS